MVIGQDSLQRPSGEAFVTFAAVEDCEKGLRYHMKHLGRRYIEIFPLFNKEYYRKSRNGADVRCRCYLLLDLQQVRTHRRGVCHAVPRERGLFFTHTVIWVMCIL